MTAESGPFLVTADQDACVGAGNCRYSAPTVFDLDDADGTVIVLRAELHEAHEISDARSAAAGCPGAAIEVTGQ